MVASTLTVRPERYALLWVDGWNPDTGEAVGGGWNIETVATGREAVEAVVAHTASCARLHGPGECVVVDREDDYRRVDPYLRQLEEEREPRERILALAAFRN